VACGSGRDLCWLKQRGFNVIGFERAKGLAELARENAECRIIEGDFETYDFSNLQVDAIILVGALFHVPHEKFKIVFKNITYGLSESGRVLITLKQGEGTFADEYGRVFSCGRMTRPGFILFHQEVPLAGFLPHLRKVHIFSF
jgi:cyclopropane fatty-acyl-phospholipid synthase-like methyltransferase